MQDNELHEILDELPVGVIIADARGRGEYANPLALIYLQCAPADLGQLKVGELLEAEKDKKELIFQGRDGARLPVRIGVTPLNEGRRLITFTDLSEIHQLQQQLLQMDRLASVGELTSGIAHEIRNPLAGIKTTAQALEREMGAGDPQRAYVSRIIMEVDRLNKLLLNFFDFAKPKALTIRECDLGKVIADAVFMVRNTAQDRHVHIEELYPSKAVRVEADRDMIQQVIMNILLNGIQAMDNGGTLKVQLVQRKDVVRVAVTDTGVGISESLRSKIFDPFFTTKAKGIGLGLSISYRIIRMHAGSISCESAEHGTIFVITLPRQHPGGDKRI